MKMCNNFFNKFEIELSAKKNGTANLEENFEFQAVALSKSSRSQVQSFSSIEFEMSVACWVHMSTCLLTLSIPEYTRISLNEPHFNINWAIYSHILHGKHVSSCNFKIASILEPRFSEIAVLLSGKRWCIKNEAFNVEIKRNNFIKDPQNDLGSTIFIHDPSDTILIVQFCFHDLETLGF